MGIAAHTKRRCPFPVPNWIDEQVDGLDRASVDVETLLQGQRTRYEAALKNLQKTVPQSALQDDIARSLMRGLPKPFPINPMAAREGRVETKGV